MAAVAVAKEMKPHGFSVNVRLITAPGGPDGATLESEIHLSEEYTPREAQILYNAARSCEVHHLLRGPITFRERLTIGSDAGA